MRNFACSLIVCGLLVAHTSLPVFASQGIAQNKSQRQASEGKMRHVGGSMGSGRYEGVGFSTVSADDAIRRSCYWGKKTPVDIGVAKGPNGWYATVLYR